MRSLFVILTLASFMFASVGKISSARGDVQIVRNNQHIQAQIGQDLEKKDTILTQKHSNAQIIFSDDTSVNVGYNSSFSIEEYLVDNKDNSQVALRANRGAIRVLTGKIGKIAPKRFKLSTQTSTIGIRGTNFIVLTDGKKDEIYCSHGEIVVNSKHKSINVPAGNFIKIDPTTKKLKSKKYSQRQLKKVIDKDFRSYATQKISKNELDKNLNPNNAIKSVSDDDISKNESMMINKGATIDPKSPKEEKIIANESNDFENSQVVPSDSDVVEDTETLTIDETDKDFVLKPNVATYSTKGQKFEGTYISADTKEVTDLSSDDYMEMTFDFGSNDNFLKNIDGFIGSGVENSYIQADGSNDVKFNKDDLSFQGDFSQDGTLSGKFSSNEGKFIEDGKIMKKNASGENLIDANFEASRSNINK